MIIQSQYHTELIRWNSNLFSLLSKKKEMTKYHTELIKWNSNLFFLLSKEEKEN